MATSTKFSRVGCFRRLLPALIVAALAAALVGPAAAFAAGNPPGQPEPSGAPAGNPTLVASMDKSPAGFHMTPKQVLALAEKNPTVRAAIKQNPTLKPYVYTREIPTWQVSWFLPPPKSTEMIQLYVNDSTRAVTQVWTGYQVAWTMARGYPGAFGKKINALYIWIPLCLFFFMPFFPWRRRPTLWHLDLLVLLAYSVSLAFFNQANLGLSVPLLYPPMIYLLARMILLAFGRGIPKAPLRMTIPVPVLAILLIFLVGFRFGLNVTNSNVIDVGYAGVIGADKIVHGQPLYGNWPTSNPQGDTYGPSNYYSYIPAYMVFGWSGSWDDLPTAHAAAIIFDLLTMLALFLLGRSLRGPPTGIVLAYLWAAFPFTAFVLESNSNDALVAFSVVLCLLLLRWATVRGAAGAFAGLTKFAPLALAPLLLRGIGPPPTISQIIRYCVGYALMIAALMLVVFVHHDWAYFWNDTIRYQAGRPAPFSIWGLWGGPSHSLEIPEKAVLGLGVALGLVVLRWPRGERTVMQVAALGAAIIITLQCGISYWFYLYIVWFYPLVIAALVLAHPPAGATLQSASSTPRIDLADSGSAAVSINAP